MVQSIQFDNGQAYELYMGLWSQMVGDAFLRWLAPKPGWSWLDVGCGNGAFTELILQRCSPQSVQGVDPSEAQLAYARTRPDLRSVSFKKGDAMALPFDNATFDIAVMPLVLFFVPNPAQGVAEMIRVVKPGGWVTAYGWDLLKGGFPYHSLRLVLEESRIPVPMPPHPEAGDKDVLQSYWAAAGLENIEIQSVSVQRTFPEFENYWNIVKGAPSVGQTIDALTPPSQQALQKRLKEVLPINSAGQIISTARAHVIKGTVPR